MKSDIIAIDNQSNGFNNAVEETKKVAAYQNLSHKDAICLQLCAEEMLSMARSITGEMKASFWIENEGKRFELHMSTKPVLDKEKRWQLISAATSRKNEAAQTFLGKLRDAFENAMTADVNRGDQIPNEILADLPNRFIEDPEWDGYERSVLRRVSDEVKVGIRGGMVELTVVKAFG